MTKNMISRRRKTVIHLRALRDAKKRKLARTLPKSGQSSRADARNAEFVKGTEMTEDETAYYRQLYADAGILPSEIREDPVYGTMLTVSAVRKLAAVAPDQAAAEAVLDQVARAVRGTFRLVD
jgi:hypothetical protein